MPTDQIIENLGNAKVEMIFQKGLIGGCSLSDGIVTLDGTFIVDRNGEQIYRGGCQTLKSFGSEVDQIEHGEFGLMLGNSNEEIFKFKKGDTISCMLHDQTKRKPKWNP